MTDTERAAEALAGYARQRAELAEDLLGQTMAALVDGLAPGDPVREEWERLVVSPGLAAGLPDMSKHAQRLSTPVLAKKIMERYKVLAPLSTPGPWRVYQGWVHPTFGNASPHETNGDTAICEPLGPDRKANAHLLAAAPNLRDACKAALRYIDGLNSAAEEKNAVVGELMAALKRVPGAAPCRPGPPG